MFSQDEECEPLLSTDEVHSDRNHPGDDARRTDQIEVNEINKLFGSLSLRSLYLLVQGILAGFSFVSLYGREAAANDFAFLVSYNIVAADHRRFFYILTSAALVGSLDITLGIFGVASSLKDDAEKHKSSIIHQSSLEMLPSAFWLFK